MHKQCARVTYKLHGLLSNFNLINGLLSNVNLISSLWECLLHWCFYDVDIGQILTKQTN